MMALIYIWLYDMIMENLCDFIFDCQVETRYLASLLLIYWVSLFMKREVSRFYDNCINMFMIG